MKPLSTSAIRIFALISANVGNLGHIHIRVLMHILKAPKSEVECAIIELLSHEYIHYNIDTQYIHLVKTKTRSKTS